MNILWLYLVAINVWTFSVMGVDKNRARNAQYRISEKTLWSLSLLGGSAGAWAGMYVFRHKTRKAKFVIGIPAILLAQIALGLWSI